jgi:hypothetical protein
VNTIKKYDESRPLEVFSDEEEEKKKSLSFQSKSLRRNTSQKEEPHTLETLKRLQKKEE